MVNDVKTDTKIGRRPVRMQGLTLLSSILFCALISCSTRPVYTPEDPFWFDNDMKDISEPGMRDPSLIWETVERTSFRQAEELLDIDRSLHKIAGRPKQSWNINSFDEVPNSSWYTNRHHLYPMTAEQLRAGMIVGGGPDTTGPWVVFRPKVGGVTAGFWIKDSKGDAYILKFDPPGNPELATSAAAIAGRVLYACGYNVPEETITWFHPDNLRIKDGVTYKDVNGNKQPFTREKLNEILELAYRNPDGTIRCLASLALPDIKGPFSFDGRRSDDPNDWCDHEHRRELRALYVFCSFINHWDIKDQNTMDIFVGRDGKGHLKHYLLDFGSTLGSAGHGAQHFKSGYANSFDLRDLLISLITLGLKKWQWEDAKSYEYPSVGYFESEIFHPAKWDPIYPIPAFENMTDRDAFWGAKIVMSFRDNDLRAIIDAGQLTNPAAREYLLNTLTERRDKMGRYWFGKVNPLDKFVFIDEDSGVIIDFEDLSVLYGLEDEATTSYDYEIFYDGIKVGFGRKIRSTRIELSSGELDTMKKAYQQDDRGREKNLFKLAIRTIRNDKVYSGPVVLWLWYHPEEPRFQLVGIEHLD